jgi:hypothetical protein
MASSGNTWFKKLLMKQKRYALRHTKARWALDAEGNPVVKVREYLAPVDAHFVPRKPRGRSGVRMSHEKRMQVLARLDKRREFFAGLGVEV